MIASLELASGISSVVFCDERDRGPYETPPGTFASITLDGDDTSWGEFLTREQVFAVIGWLTTLVANDAETAHTTAHDSPEKPS